MAIRFLFCILSLIVLSETLLAEELILINPKAAQVPAQAPKVIVVPVGQTRVEALKKLAEAQRQSFEAIKSLAEAQQALINAKTEAEKTEASKLIDEARKAITQAKALVETRMKAAQNAATRQPVIVRNGTAYQSSPGSKPLKAVEDPIERLLMLTPSGPIVVEASITIEGKPFRSLRDDLVDQMLKGADIDKDGQCTWEETFSSTHFNFGRYRTMTDQQKQSTLRNYDKNNNGLVDREEARNYLTRVTNTQDFLVVAGSGMRGGYNPRIFSVNGRIYSQGNAAGLDLMPLLDSDKDGVLSEKEIQAAGERLKSRDADDNDLLYAQEVTTNANVAGNNRPVFPNPQMRPTTRNSTIALDEGVTAKQLYHLIWQQYQTAEAEVTKASFPALPGLFASLDKNQDGKLQEEESLAFLTIEPHLKLAVDLGENGKGVSLVKANPALTPTPDVKSSICLELPGTNLKADAELDLPKNPYNDRLGENLSRPLRQRQQRLFGQERIGRVGIPVDADVGHQSRWQNFPQGNYRILHSNTRPAKLAGVCQCDQYGELDF